MSDRSGGKQVSCLAWGRPLSRFTATCPTCGTLQPHKRLGSSLGLGLLLALLLALIDYSALAGASAPYP